MADPILYPKYLYDSDGKGILVKSYEEEIALTDKATYYPTPSAAWKARDAKKEPEAPKVPEQPKTMAAAVPIPQEEVKEPAAFTAKKPMPFVPNRSQNYPPKKGR